jgi:dihydropteroate synthase
MKQYVRPLTQVGPARPASAVTLAAGWAWFTHAEVLRRDHAPEIIAAADLPADVLGRLRAPRAPIAGVSMEAPRLMGILNVTPDSFSDGGLFDAPQAALSHARTMAGTGADILDIGGESTRPGATLVPAREEIARTEPMIRAVAGGVDAPVSIDTRKAEVAQAALAAGAAIVNDVSAFTYDAELGAAVAASTAPVCLMHAQGDPTTMQQAPHYEDVLLDVYDFLEERIAHAQSLGINRDRIIIDPGIGFGKALEHNLALLARLSLFHSLGCPLLLGVSRKRFIGDLGQAAEARARMPGSLAVALAGIAQGAQITRVHDVAETRQALTLWLAANGLEG